ncbi:hypothetical protein L228DRAFT_169881 [Xylona heveae TC161]|uniref:Uncharacterized protein n=1 Tax=Xylona heveae (strain CBS 132557 / TC161) TaxID=1328760 RepID=A0A165FRH9_XYLHT|nr:hypothetical protein L228DRAFT_169881 [Xylona heveae TC161]KZF21291.1 hypothetical protein L228DRAFT_169881 [Xylona heveae TC161]
MDPPATTTAGKASIHILPSSSYSRQPHQVTCQHRSVFGPPSTLNRTPTGCAAFPPTKLSSLSVPLNPEGWC